MIAERLAELTSKFANARVAVVGDFFLDKYLDVEPSLAEHSVETGKTAHQVVAVRATPGAAGTVMANLAALGAGKLFAIGFTGDDGEGYELRRGLGRLNCDTTHLACVAEKHTPTYLKPRDRHEQGLLGEHERYDTKNRTPTSASVGEQIVASIDALLPEVDALVIMDQVEEADCGVVTAAVREAIGERAKDHPEHVFFADSRRFIHNFRHVLIKPNEFEAVAHDLPKPGECIDVVQVGDAAQSLRARNQAPVCVTLGSRGIGVTDPEWTVVRGLQVDGDIDPTGAGDSVTAATVLSLCAGASMPEAALVANLVASITIQQLATTGTASPEQLVGQLELWHQQG